MPNMQTKVLLRNVGIPDSQEIETYIKRGGYRAVEQSLDLGWEVLSLLPVEELHRVSEEEIDKYYKG